MNNQLIINLPTLDMPMVISNDLFNAIMKVESGGDVDAVGDGGRSIGPFQIQKSYYDDAVQKDSSLTADGKTYQNCKGPGSIEYSKRVTQAYMNRYATEGRLGHKPTDEDIARIHNGGPNGYKNPATEKYWAKVKKELK